MQFASYTSVQFDEEETCIGGTSSPWDPHVYNGTSSGIFNLILTLNGTTSCPEITNSAWEDIGMVCFDIVDPSISPDLEFDADNTQFNSAATNDGSNTIELGVLNKISNPEALSCQQATDGTGSPTTTNLALKVLLQGPLNESTGLMNDDLRSLQYIPLQEPYTSIANFVHAGDGGGELTNTSVLGENGNNSIVDWVFIELRSAIAPTSVIATKSALLQRDGDVVDLDGVSPVAFTDMLGSYYVAIDHIFFELFLTLWAANPNGEISYNSVLDGYFNSDTNMDGQVKFQGPRNDIDALIFFNILNHPSNENFLLNYIVTEHNNQPYL